MRAGMMGVRTGRSEHGPLDDNVWVVTRAVRKRNGPLNMGTGRYMDEATLCRVRTRSGWRREEWCGGLM